MTTLLLDPMSKPSVLWPRLPVSPAEESMVMSVMVSPSQLAMLTA